MDPRNNQQPVPPIGEFENLTNFEWYTDAIAGPAVFMAGCIVLVR